MSRRSACLDSPKAIHNHLTRDIPRDEFDRPGIRFVVCDERNEVQTHLHIHDVPPEAEAIAGAVTSMVEVTAHFPDFGMVVAAMRAGAPTLTTMDSVLYRAAHAACAENGVRLLGVHVLTPHGHREVCLDDAIGSGEDRRGGAAKTFSPNDDHE